jgi:hypothetical protein
MQRQVRFFVLIFDILLTLILFCDILLLTMKANLPPVNWGCDITLSKKHREKDMPITPAYIDFPLVPITPTNLAPGNLKIRVTPFLRHPFDVLS